MHRSRFVVASRAAMLLVLAAGCSDSGTLIGDILIMDNPMLPSCQIDALAAQIDGPPVPVGAFGNDDSATCP